MILDPAIENWWGYCFLVVAAINLPLPEKRDDQIEA